MNRKLLRELVERAEISRKNCNRRGRKKEVRARKSEEEKNKDIEEAEKNQTQKLIASLPQKMRIAASEGKSSIVAMPLSNREINVLGHMGWTVGECSSRDSYYVEKGKDGEPILYGIAAEVNNWANSRGFRVLVSSTKWPEDSGRWAFEGKLIISWGESE